MSDNPAGGRRRVPPEVRFWPKVNKDGPVHPALGTACWEWLASVDVNDGYGQFGLSAGHMVRAHRYAWELAHGHPGAMMVLHRCDNRRCVRVDHLFLGTQPDNMADCKAKGRNHVTATLTPEEVTRIRWDRIIRREPLKVVAEEFGVAASCVSRIATGTRWRRELLIA